jgi:hypothetical protein
MQRRVVLELSESIRAKRRGPRLPPRAASPLGARAARFRAFRRPRLEVPTIMLKSGARLVASGPMRPSAPTAILLAVLSVLPAAQGGWGGGPGSHEPDTPQDADQGRMFRDPPTLPRQVYFDAFPSVEELTVNPNVAALGGRVLPVGPTPFRAFLGLWADCNADGYVGSAEGALQDYPSALVKDPVACPVGGEHNDGQWTSEMLMIGMVDPCERRDATYRAERCGGVSAFFADTRVVYVDSARVWGDAGRPGEAQEGCPLLPLPGGATSGPGAALRALDCQDGRAVANRLAATDPRLLPLLEAPLPTSAFRNPQTGQAGLVERGSGDPAATTWDCSQRKWVALADPTGGRLNDVAVEDPSGGALSGPQVLPVAGTQTIFADEDHDTATPGVLRPAPDDAGGSLLWVPRPAPALRDAKGSWWDAAESAADGPRGDCDPATDNALGQHYEGSLVEGRDPQGSATGGKARNDLVFTFYDGYRGLDRRVDPTLRSENFPTDLGLVQMRNQHGGPLWSSMETPVERPALVRADDLSVEGPAWLTFYADVPADGVSVPTTSPATYGDEACPVIGRNADAGHGWACDPARWWRDARDADTMPRYSDGQPLGAVPGDAYLLRDVDCHDGTVASGAPAGAGLAHLSQEGLCPAA